MIQIKLVIYINFELILYYCHKFNRLKRFCLGHSGLEITLISSLMINISEQASIILRH